MNELVDAYAVSAIDAFGTALVALAHDRPDGVPACVKPYVAALGPHVETLRGMLADA